jgi:hypothetical protein
MVGLGIERVKSRILQLPSLFYVIWHWSDTMFKNIYLDLAIILVISFNTETTKFQTWIYFHIQKDRIWGVPQA